MSKSSRAASAKRSAGRTCKCAAHQHSSHFRRVLDTPCFAPGCKSGLRWSTRVAIPHACVCHKVQGHRNIGNNECAVRVAVYQLQPFNRQYSLSASASKCITRPRWSIFFRYLIVSMALLNKSIYLPEFVAIR